MKMLKYLFTALVLLVGCNTVSHSQIFCYATLISPTSSTTPYEGPAGVTMIMTVDASFMVEGYSLTPSTTYTCSVNYSYGVYGAVSGNVSATSVLFSFATDASGNGVASTVGLPSANSSLGAVAVGLTVWTAYAKMDQINAYTYSSGDEQDGTFYVRGVAGGGGGGDT